MRVNLLKNGAVVYSSQAYLVRGEWNRLEDINTLVDTGSSSSIVALVEAVATGFGKHPVEQIILTHSHTDHVGGLMELVKKHQPRVFAYARFEGVTDLLHDGQVIRMGDCDFEVIHAPWHSDDSICLYCATERVLFSGDAPLRIRTPGGTYRRSFVGFLERLCRSPVDVLYSGHDLPVTEGVAAMLAETLENVRQSRIVEATRS